MRDYYTLMELMVFLKHENTRIIKQLDILNVFLKYNESKNSLNFGFDYDVIDGKIIIKHILSSNEGLSFFSQISLMTKKNESKVLEFQNDYVLEKTNIATINPVFQQHFNLEIRNILCDFFLNEFYFKYEFNYKEKECYLIITPTKLRVTRFDEQNKVDFEFIFSPKTSVLDFSKNEYLDEIGDFVNIKILKTMFTNDIIILIDNVLNACGKSEFSENNLVLQDYLYGNPTLLLTDKLQIDFTKRKNY